MRQDNDKQSQKSYNWNSRLSYLFDSLNFKISAVLKREMNDKIKIKCKKLKTKFDYFVIENTYL